MLYSETGGWTNATWTVHEISLQLDSVVNFDSFWKQSESQDIRSTSEGILKLGDKKQTEFKNGNKHVFYLSRS
jgi:hypothetical protein